MTYYDWQQLKLVFAYLRMVIANRWGTRSSVSGNRNQHKEDT